MNHNLPLGGHNTRTNTSDSSTEVRQDGGASVTHLTLDGELSFDIDLSDSSPDHKGGNTRQKGGGREDDNSNKFREHALLIPRMALRLYGIVPLTVLAIITGPRDAKIGRDAPDCISCDDTSDRCGIQPLHCCEEISRR